MSKELKRKWSKEVSDKLIGREIVAVRYMTEKERKDRWWSKSAVVIQLDDGTSLSPMSDDEGNEAGSFATDLEDLPVIPSI